MYKKLGRFHVNFGLSSYTYAWEVGVPGYPVANPLDTFKLLQRTADYGLNLLQIADNLPLDALSTQQQMNLYQKAQSLNVTLEVGTRGIMNNNLKTYLEISKRLHSRLLRVVIDREGHEPSPQKVIRLFAKELPAFENENIILGIENHDRFKVKTLAHIINTLASSHLGIVLDTVNSFGALEPPELVVETLGPYTVNLHIKDFDVRRASHNLGLEIYGTPAGQGRLDIPAIVKQLGDYGREFTSILEFWAAPEATVEASIAKEKRWAEQSIKYLKEW
jgi:3-oxoisoapionate decarboxylase